LSAQYEIAKELIQAAVKVQAELRRGNLGEVEVTQDENLLIAEPDEQDIFRPEH
jgi:hypothetical protein